MRMNDSTDEPLRWLYRYEHFQSALALLREAAEIYRRRTMSDLEKEGLISRFSFTWELSWKVVKDYLQADGAALEVLAPRPIIRAGFAAGILADSAVWMQALDARNSLAHIYSGAMRDSAISDIVETYVAMFSTLDTFLNARRP